MVISDLKKKSLIAVSNHRLLLTIDEINTVYTDSLIIDLIVFWSNSDISCCVHSNAMLREKQQKTSNSGGT